jgi:hypothetical protein
MSDHDFTMHFEIPVEPPVLAGQSSQDIERAFAARQIEILLQFVTLYQNGKPVRPDAFAIVNAPELIHTYPPADMLQRAAGTYREPEET